MYRTCCITTGNSPALLSVTTLFDTGANPTSFVNRQVAAWIESQQSHPFVMQGYDNTLCSLTMKRLNRPLVPQERHWRPHANAFADITPIDDSTLIERIK